MLDIEETRQFLKEQHRFGWHEAQRRRQARLRAPAGTTSESDEEIICQGYPLTALVKCDEIANPAGLSQKQLDTWHAMQKRVHELWPNGRPAFVWAKAKRG